MRHDVVLLSQPEIPSILVIALLIILQCIVVIREELSWFIWARPQSEFSRESSNSKPLLVILVSSIHFSRNVIYERPMRFIVRLGNEFG